MAEKKLNVRLLLKIDTVDNWSNSSLILKKGEVAIGTVTGVDGTEVASPLIKVGDGSKTWAQLGYLYAKAMDVAAWAKASVKPTYNGTEILVDTAADAKTVAAAIKDLEGLVAAAATKEELEALEAYVGDIPEGYTETNIVAYINKKAEETLNAASGGSSESAASVLAALNTYKSENNAKVQANADAIDAIEADYLKAADKKELEDAVAAEKERAMGVEGGLETRLAAVEADYLKEADIADMATDAEVEAAVKTEADRAKGVEQGLADRLATVEGDYLKAADKTELQGNIDTLTGVVETLRDGIDAEKVDGVKDLIAYVETHGTEVTGMQDNIKANAEAIEALDGRMDDAEAALGTVDTRIANAITDANLGQYALDSDLDKVDGRVAALEAIDHDAYAAADAALKNELTPLIDAKAAQTDLDALDGRVDALEGAGHQNADQVNAAIDAKINALNLEETYEVKGSANLALQDAKAYADDLNTAMNTRVEALEGKDYILNGDSLVLDCGTSVE